jgi:hypothetical protein
VRHDQDPPGLHGLPRRNERAGAAASLVGRHDVPPGGGAGRVARSVLGTGGHTYDRFVHHRGFCLITETTKPAWVPTRDTPQCFVGYTCVEADYWIDR